VYLESFREGLAKAFKGSLFRVGDAEKVHPRAKEYLYRLYRSGRVVRVGWGWYYVPAGCRDAWDFLAGDRGFKVVIKQTAASIWNYDFIHRDVFRLAVRERSYGRALEEFARRMGWRFEVEYHERIPYEYRRVGELYVETPESCIVSCMSEWSFVDAYATLYFRRGEIDFDRLRRMARWRRISGTSTRVWTAIKYGCNLLNEKIGERIFKVRHTHLEHNDIKELVEEAVEKVAEFA